MNAPSLFRIVVGVGAVVGSFAVGKTLITGAQKLSVSKTKYTKLDAELDKQEIELDQKRKIREDLLKG